MCVSCWVSFAAIGLGEELDLTNVLLRSVGLRSRTPPSELVNTTICHLLRNSCVLKSWVDLYETLKNPLSVIIRQANSIISVILGDQRTRALKDT